MGCDIWNNSSSRSRLSSGAGNDAGLEAMNTKLEAEHKVQDAKDKAKFSPPKEPTHSKPDDSGRCDYNGMNVEIV